MTDALLALQAVFFDLDSGFDSAPALAAEQPDAPIDSDRELNSIWPSSLT
jgi:hypothetical protein